MEETKAVMSKEFVKELSNQSREFCIIGLTGKVRSGTSDVCRLLASPDFPKLMDLPAIYQEGSEPDAREYRIIYRYLRENWKPFVELSVTSVIISYVLDLKEKLDELSVPAPLDNTEEPIGKTIHKILKNCASTGSEGNTFRTEVQRLVLLTDDILCYDITLRKRDGKEDDLKNKVALERETRRKKLEIAYEGFFKDFSILGESSIFDAWDKTNAYLSGSGGSDQTGFKQDQTQEQEEYFRAFTFCFGVLPALEKALKKELQNDAFPIAFQGFGNNIRAIGSATNVSEKNKDKINAENLFALPSRVNRFIKLLRKYPLEEQPADSFRERRTSVYVVINNFKNIFEAYYFKRRYSAFYLLAVACDEGMRRERFADRKKYYLSNLREDLSSGKKIFKFVESVEGNEAKIREKYSNDLDDDRAKRDFALHLSNSIDYLRYNSYLQNLAPFILQDVVTCIETADIFVTRDYQETNWRYDQQLIRLLGRIVALILHPGMLTPTRIERCMQIAMTAKLNSGCLSRQVGAVVTDREYNILSLGWNDAPCGAESCLRRNFFDLARKSDKKAYSRYELENEEYRSYVEEVKSKLSPRMEELKGLPMAFCFKDIYQDIIKQRDQIYTRALHGEERALAACDNQRAKGGYLFTTSSPCELCAKRAKEVGISRIYYIEQYPGISQSHVTQIGPLATQAKYEFFVGAVGLAYIKLYTPLIPYKDELAALNFSPFNTYSKLKSPESPEESEDKPADPPEDRSCSDEPDQPQQPGQIQQDE